MQQNRRLARQPGRRPDEEWPSSWRAGQRSARQPTGARPLPALSRRQHAAPQAYPIASHWVWSDHGFLKATRPDALYGSGAIDFAGAGAVHALGGISALWCTKLIRERIGRFDAEGYVSTA
jgi:hypothetical protein